ncbi:hypothetical protein CDAR_29081 [Caerostris darwini]|uniref:Lipase domain-containing protein n=1 Tax=Caerostris darwini TaxID=1538125 RepID=A0AAV4N827_9ARAC|nr:hypothetical protein CDAR_29081 [Caerostris darwini]
MESAYVNTGLDPENVHIIGQSYGAQVAGAAGRNTPNLGRITGLDPGAPLFSPIPIFTPLGYNDANFVDVIHTSNLKYGFGIYDPIGDVNFYPNGGARQPQCDPSNNKSQSYELMLRYRNCNHQSAPNFFLQSINTTECLFWSVHCDSYDDFLGGQCPPGSSLVNLMGLPAKKIPGLSPKSKFYLRTGVQFPYCLKNGYEPA